MQESTRQKALRLPLIAFSLLLVFVFLPLFRAEAAQVTVRIDTGSTLESALAAAFAREGEVAYEEIERLVVTGNGQLTDVDGAFVRENLTNLRVLNLRGFTGGSGNAAFRGCTTLESLLLPERFVISREMFYGCSSLEEVVWPVHYQLTKDCFAYCALDFSGGYPNLLNDRNVLTFAANQRPKVYFTMPGGNAGTIGAGDTFETPYSLRTQSGSSFQNLVSEGPVWLLTRQNELEVTTTITREGERVEELDTAETGEYEITYSLPYTTYADTRTQVYTLRVVASHENLTPLLDTAKDKDEEGYTRESWEALQEALQEAEEAMASTSAVQADVDRARSQLSTALEGLQIALEGAPEHLYVGDSFELAPGKGSASRRSSWAWDEDLLEGTRFGRTATFTALQAGEAQITYRHSNGEAGVLNLIILAPGQEPPKDALPQQEQEQTPDTGDIGPGPWLVAAGLCLVLLLVLLRHKRKAR